MNITDLIDLINENPEIQRMIEDKMQEKQDAAILAQEEELTKQIYVKNAELEELKSKIKFLEADIDNLTMIRDGLHKRFMKKHADKMTKQISSDDVHLAYETLCDIKQTCGTSFEFKHFDNLVRGRCKTTTLFYSKWTKADVIDVLLINKCSDIVDRIA